MGEGSQDGGGKFNPRGIKDALVRRFSRTPEQQMQEKAERLELWIGQGLDFMKQRYFGDAINYFEDKNMAAQVGIKWSHEDMSLAAMGDGIEALARKHGLTYGGDTPTNTWNARGEGVTYVQIHVSRALVVQYKNTRYQLDTTGPYRYLLQNQQLLVEENRAGTLIFRYKNKTIPYTIIGHIIKQPKVMQVASAKSFQERQVLIHAKDPWAEPILPAL